MRVATPSRFTTRSRCATQGGFSYLEVILATALIAVSLAPALEALQGAIQAVDVHTSQALDHFQLVAGLEETLAQPFAELDAEAVNVASPGVPTLYSDAAGSPGRRLVYLSRYDGDNADADGNPFTGTDPGLLWVKVEMEETAQALETLTTP